MVISFSVISELLIVSASQMLQFLPQNSDTELTDLIFDGKTYHVHIPPDKTRVMDVVSILKDLSDFPTNVVWDKAKFFSDKKLYKLSDQFSSIPRKITLMATRFEEVIEAENIKSALLKEEVVSRPSKVPSQKRKSLPSRDFGFGEIVVLEQFKDADDSYSYLYEFATDPGILGVMKAHRWFVPKLIEMYPSGEVGIDPVCVLGLNVNNGQEIHLRLRTDNLKGYRNRNVIMKTLYHELAHNQISEHSDEFYALVSSLEKEGERLDWTKSKGYTLGTGHRRPGLVPTKQGVLRIAAHTQAATTQLQGEIRDDDLGFEEKGFHGDTKVNRDEQAPNSSRIMQGSRLGSDESLDKQSEVDQDNESNKAQLRKFSDALSLIRKECDASQAGYRTAKETLLGIINKAIDSSEATGDEFANLGKYRQIRIENEQFRHRVKSISGAIEFLTASGFVSHSDGWLRLPLDRDSIDLGLLHLAKYSLLLS